MTWVLVALLPGLGAMTYVWGIGIVYNVALLSIICLATEAAAVFAKQALGNAPGENTVKKWSGHLFDGSNFSDGLVDCHLPATLHQLWHSKPGWAGSNRPG